MQLVAKAKPVKIRIKSGGEEHTSLNSLKRNFNISDIQPLLDGRLERWLYQQGENELAFKVSNFRQNDLDTVPGTMELIKIFFPDYIANNHINSLYDIIQKWNNSYEFKKNKDYLLYFLIYLDMEYTKYVYNHRDELQCNDIDWNLVFANQIELKGNRDAEAYYIYGKLLLADESKQEIAFEYIVLAAQLGWSDASYFMDNFGDSQSNSYLFPKYNVDKIRKRTIVQWRNTYRNQGYRFLPGNPGTFKNNTEKAVWKFIIDCDEVYRLRKYGEHLSKAKELRKNAMITTDYRFLLTYWGYVIGICGDFQYVKKMKNDDLAESILYGRPSIGEFAFNTLRDKLNFVINKLLNDLS